MSPTERCDVSLPTGTLWICVSRERTSFRITSLTTSTTTRQYGRLLRGTQREKREERDGVDGQKVFELTATSCSTQKRYIRTYYLSVIKVKRILIAKLVTGSKIAWTISIFSNWFLIAFKATCKLRYSYIRLIPGITK